MSIVAGLKAIKNAGSSPFYMTADEGQELAQKGLIVVNPSDCCPTNRNAFRVMLTSAGEKELQMASQNTVPGFMVRSDVAIPVIKRGNPNIKRERKSLYPFDIMEIGQSFHVPVTNSEPEPWKKLASSVNAANKRSEVEVVPQQIETRKVRKLQKGSDGKPMLDGNGKKIYVEDVVTAPKMTQSKRFKCCRVGANDPDGPGARVFRVELKV